MGTKLGVAGPKPPAAFLTTFACYLGRAHGRSGSVKGRTCLHQPSSSAPTRGGSSRAAAHIPTFLSNRTSSARSPDLNTAMVSSRSSACFWKARSIKCRPVLVSRTILLRRSFGLDVLRISFLDSRRSTAAVIEPLVSRTFRPMIFTGCGPLCRSTSNTAKSERPRPKAERLRVAFCSIAWAAFHITSQTRVAGSRLGLRTGIANCHLLLNPRLSHRILDME